MQNYCRGGSVGTVAHVRPGHFVFGHKITPYGISDWLHSPTASSQAPVSSTCWLIQMVPAVFHAMDDEQDNFTHPASRHHSSRLCSGAHLNPRTLLAMLKSRPCSSWSRTPSLESLESQLHSRQPPAAAVAVAAAGAATAVLAATRLRMPCPTSKPQCTSRSMGALDLARNQQQQQRLQQAPLCRHRRQSTPPTCLPSPGLHHPTPCHSLPTLFLLPAPLGQLHQPTLRPLPATLAHQGMAAATAAAAMSTATGAATASP